jgi:hypothetical protein
VLIQRGVFVSIAMCSRMVMSVCFCWLFCTSLYMSVQDFDGISFLRVTDKGEGNSALVSTALCWSRDRVKLSLQL